MSKQGHHGYNHQEYALDYVRLCESNKGYEELANMYGISYTAAHRRAQELREEGFRLPFLPHWATRRSSNNLDKAVRLMNEYYEELQRQRRSRKRV